MQNRIYFTIKKQHMVSLERPGTSGQNPQMLLSYCRKLNAGPVQPLLLSALLIQYIYIKNWEKYETDTLASEFGSNKHSASSR
jgi:hypothetical protein